MATNLSKPVIKNPIDNQIVSINAADTILNLTNYFDDPLTTGKVAHFNLANTSIGAIGNGVINIVLFDQTGGGAPLTVQNFQNYVSAGSYTNSFIHRSIPNFIVQGGGFTYNNSSLTTIPTNAPVQNEFSPQRSNIRGTIAMAKLGSDPNSATNQWFFNLADNSSNLNNQNGGFTVFGQALAANDLATIDAISAIKTYNYGTTFSDLPLTQNALSDTNFIRFSSINITQEKELTFAIVGNSKPTLVTPSINNNQLVLDYLPNQTGNSDITVRATNLFGEFIDYKIPVSVLPSISLTLSSTRINEDSTGQLVYTLTRNGDLTSSLTTSYSVNGTATFGTDYTQTGATNFTATTGSVIFAAGSATATLIIDPNTDTKFESDETVALTLASGTGYAIATSTPVTGAIANDDIATYGDKLTTPIIRFQNTDKPGTYLFAGEQEAASIRQNYKGFKEEGLAFQVAVSKDDPLMQPFYRFRNTEKGREGTYLFAGEQEATSIRSKFKNFVEEGLAFYAYSAGVGGGTTDFARFQNKGLPGTYLFTGPSETNSVRNNSSFILEGSAFAAAG
jgi:cyclophilin family peptidyl-prolyl cis-trans isomerase